MIERRNPLPPGTYWVDVFAKDEMAFNTWLGKHSDSVSVIRAEQHPDADPPWNWMLFKVSKPVPWEGPGLPTVGEGEANSEETVDKPKTRTPTEEAEHLIHEAGDAVKTGLTLAGLGIAGLLLYKVLK